jgi:hypothetical protein
LGEKLVELGNEHEIQGGGVLIYERPEDEPIGVIGMIID